MNFRNKKLVVYTLVVCFSIIFTSCSPKTSIETVCTITSPKMGDSKIFFDKLIASTEGHLILFNFDGSVFREFKDVTTNWISTCESEQFVIAGNFNKEIRMIQFDDNYSIISNTIHFRNSNLMIDPTILKVNEKWFLTYVEIEGV